MRVRLESFLVDVRLAVRGLIRRPTLALTAILAASLGVGTTTAVFSVVDRILFRPLPYADQNRLVSLGLTAPLDTNEFMLADGYFELRRNPGPLEAVTSFQAGNIPCDLNERNPARLRCLRLERNFLETFGIVPIVGRSFTLEEDLPNGPRVAMVSYGLWRNRFASDPNIVARTIPLDGAATIVVGVLPENFEMPTLTPADVVLPEALNEATERSGRALRVFGRLKPGISVEQARLQLQPFFERSLQTVPSAFRKEVGLRVQSVRDRQVGTDRLISFVLFGAVLCVLLIACANIANLLLARAVTREREMAMRAALGATRFRLARMALTESMILGIAGGITGCSVAYSLLKLFISIAPQGLPRLQSASIDWRVLVFALAASIGSSVLFGAAPAFRSARAASLSSWQATTPSRGGLRSILVIVQIGVSFVLLTGAGLLLRSLWNLENVPLGMQPDRVVMAHITLGRQRYPNTATQSAFFSDLEQRLSSLPGVEAAAISDSAPPLGNLRGRPYSTIEIEGQPRIPEGTGGMVAWRYVTPGYFSALQIPIVRGRAFQDFDRAQGANTVILSSTLARRMFPNESAIGKHVLKTSNGQWSTVVGVAGDVKNSGSAQQTEPEFYLPRKGIADAELLGPNGMREAYVIARTAISPNLAAGSVRSAISAVDATLPAELETMQGRLGELEARPQFNAVLLIAFAAMGVLLAGIGIFGVMAFLVSQQTREIGVRMALGATPVDIVKWTLRHAALWTTVGLLLGLAGSFAIARLIRSFLFEVRPADPKTLVAALALLCSVALLAAVIPARRAARVTPIEALRQE